MLAFYMRLAWGAKRVTVSSLRSAAWRPHWHGTIVIRVADFLELAALSDGGGRPDCWWEGQEERKRGRVAKRPPLPFVIQSGNTGPSQGNGVVACRSWRAVGRCGKAITNDSSIRLRSFKGDGA